MREQESFRAALVRELADKNKGTVILFERPNFYSVPPRKRNELLRPAYVICSRIISSPFAGRIPERSIVNEVRCGANSYGDNNGEAMGESVHILRG